MGAKHSKQEEDEEYLQDPSLPRLDNADVNITDHNDNWVKANVIVENGKIYLDHRQSMILERARKSTITSNNDSEPSKLKNLKSGRSLLNRGSSNHLVDTSGFEIKLIDKPILRVELRDGRWEFLIHNNK